MSNPAVRCWLIAIDKIAHEAWSRMGSCLDQAEQEKAERYRLPADRRRFIATRALLRCFLGAELKLRAENVALAMGPAGKPVLPNSAIQFNVSHSGRFIAIALAQDCAVGIDVEEIRQRADFSGIARNFFHPRECADLASLSDKEALPAFYRCWTRKESIVKALGVGLRLPLASFRVSCLPGAQSQLLAVEDDGLRAGLGPNWSVYDLEPATGYAGALAAARSSLRGEVEVVRWDARDVAEALPYL
jgi:4'-phosphopantetheinyl transferase